VQEAIDNANEQEQLVRTAFIALAVKCYANDQLEHQVRKSGLASSGDLSDLLIETAKQLSQLKANKHQEVMSFVLSIAKGSPVMQASVDKLRLRVGQIKSQHKTKVHSSVDLKLVNYTSCSWVEVLHPVVFCVDLTVLLKVDELLSEAEAGGQAWTLLRPLSVADAKRLKAFISSAPVVSVADLWDFCSWKYTTSEALHAILFNFPVLLIQYEDDPVLVNLQSSVTDLVPVFLNVPCPSDDSKEDENGLCNIFLL
jgi:hypothetical protein